MLVHGGASGQRLAPGARHARGAGRRAQLDSRDCFPQRERRYGRVPGLVFAAVFSARAGAEFENSLYDPDNIATWQEPKTFTACA